MKERFLHIYGKLMDYVLYFKKRMSLLFTTYIFSLSLSLASFFCIDKKGAVIKFVAQKKSEPGVNAIVSLCKGIAR